MQRRVAFLGPPSEKFEREDAGAVAVIPGDAQGPRAVIVGVGNGQWNRAVGERPALFPATSADLAIGTGAPKSDPHQIEGSDMLVGEHDGQPLIAFDGHLDGLESFIHPDRMPPLDATARTETVSSQAMAYSTDTRTIRPGDTYVAIRGDVHDGHRFVGAAIEAGATSVVVDTASVADGLSIPDGISSTVVGDTIAHLAELASQRVAASGADVVAITGSVGKTTTKAMLVSVLTQAFPVVFAEGNLNTPLGLSLTVLNAPELDPDLHALTDAREVKIVMEMGARSVGDLAELTALFPPSVSIITVVRGVHLETFGTIEAIEHEKGELIANLRPDGVAILNADDPRVRAMATRSSARCVFYGTSPDADVGPDAVTADLPILGSHATMTAMSVIAAARVFAMTERQIAAGLESAVPERGRLVRLRGRGDATLIDDTYNASPEATLAALDVLAALPGNRRTAFLGDMLELGADEIAEHRRVLDAALLAADRIVAVGPLMAQATAQCADPARVITIDDSVAAAQFARATIGPDLGPEDVALVKGSQGLRMERVVEALLHADLDPAAVLARQSEAWRSKA